MFCMENSFDVCGSMREALHVMNRIHELFLDVLTKNEQRVANLLVV